MLPAGRTTMRYAVPARSAGEPLTVVLPAAPVTVLNTEFVVLLTITYLKFATVFVITKLLCVTVEVFKLLWLIGVTVALTLAVGVPEIIAVPFVCIV
jgi:hypothetical protein